MGSRRVGGYGWSAGRREGGQERKGEGGREAGREGVGQATNGAKLIRN